MLKALGFLMFVVVIWLGLTLYVGEPDPTTSWVLETVGLESWLPSENDPSAGQRARRNLKGAYERGQQRAWIDENEPRDPRTGR